MFNSAYKAVQEDKIQAPENLCPSYCKARPIAVFDFSSAPVKIRKNYRDKEKCSKHLIETRKTPIRYSDRKFDSLSAFKKWYHELSQGKGSDGKDLYKRCDGSCSPQYSFVISSSQGILNVTSTIICAHARDMSDNNYQVRSSFRWTCEEGDGEG